MLRRLFPTLAEWPVEKWMGLPLAFMLLVGSAAGVLDLISPAQWPPWL